LQKAAFCGLVFTLSLEQDTGRRDELHIRVRGTKCGELPGVRRQLVPVDHWRFVLGAIIAVEPREDDVDVTLASRLELFAGPGGKVDLRR
jgi:hypothetical protein